MPEEDGRIADFPNTPPEISALTKEQRTKYTNGCGPAFWHNTRSFFKDACDIHDIDYSIPFAKNSKHRLESDRRLLRNMMILVDRLPRQERMMRKIQAYIFYGCVRAFGHFFYKKN